MELTEEFWKTQRGLLLVGSDGSLRFTAAGRAKYAPRLAKHGFAITNVTTVERFREVMGVVLQRELAENTRQLERLLADPNTTEEERASIRRVLGI